MKIRPMATILNDLMLERTPHSWLRKINLIYRPGSTTPLLDSVIENMLEMFEELGHAAVPPALDRPSLC